MRTMIMSFKPAVYKKIYSGAKVFEHRRNFPDEPIKCYMYVSAPVKSITGILYLGKKHALDDWEKEFMYDTEAVERIKEFKKSARFAMEINEFQETTAIGLDTLRTDLNKFVVPQSYYYLDDTELLEYLEKNIKKTDINIKHSFTDISSDIICRH